MYYKPLKKKQIDVVVSRASSYSLRKHSINSPFHSKNVILLL